MQDLIPHIKRLTAAAIDICSMSAARYRSAYRALPGWVGSRTLHVILLILIIGIPSCEREVKRPPIIEVDLTAPTPAAPKEAPKPKAAPKPAPVPKAPVSRIPSKPTPPPEPKPTPAPKAKPEPEPPQPKEKPKPEPEPPKPKPKEEPKKEPEKDIDSMLKDFLTSEKENAEQLQHQVMNAARTIQAQMERHWVVPPSTRFSNDRMVTLRFKLNVAGELASQVSVVDQKRYQSDPTFRALADSAVRAVHAAAPFKELNPRTHEQWGNLEMTFDARGLL